jgi:hypothetical protein
MGGRAFYCREEAKELGRIFIIEQKYTSGGRL